MLVRRDSMLVRRARAARRIGSFWDDVGDAVSGTTSAIVADVVATGHAAGDVVDAISDAGKEIGAVLKFIAPIVALWPGIGTVLAVAMEAAAAYACGDAIDDAIIETAGAAIPSGPARVAFNAAADMTRAIVKGEDVKAAALRAGRGVASAVGGEQGAAAFDVGVSVARGDKVQGTIWALARQRAKDAGPTQLAAFDAAYAIAQGGDAGDAALAAARAYVGSAGGPVAAAAFDGGVAIARGKALQDAGFDALKAFAAGNELSERAVSFADKMVRAARRGEPLVKVLVQELAEDVDRYGAAFARSGAGDGAKAFIASKLQPVLDIWQPDWITWGSFDLAKALNVDETIARAAQSIMRDVLGGGVPDQALADHLMKTGVENAVDKFGAAVVAARATNETYVQTRSDIRQDLLMTALRIPPMELSYRTAQAAAAAAAPVRLTARVRLPDAPSPAPAPAVAAPAPPDVQQAPSSAPRSGPLANVALGGVIAAAVVAVVWWAKT